MTQSIKEMFNVPISVKGNLLSYGLGDAEKNQEQTNQTFSEKWQEVSQISNVEELYKMQYDWFLQLYGFNSVDKLGEYLSNKTTILDTGCGLGYKAAWFATLSPSSLVIGMDYSDAIYIAAEKYRSIPNLFFIKGDIADTKLKESSIDFVVCDQVIMHTEDPEKTFAHLTNITKSKGEFACYVYSKKALPRELVDDYFRKETHHISKEEMWEFASQLTELGRRLSDLKVEFEAPDIPLLNIKGGKYDIQRFIYWNFLKCFWKPEWGFDLSKSTNFDWYAPSNAKRFSQAEFEALIRENKLDVTFFHKEEACYSGRFRKA